MNTYGPGPYSAPSANFRYAPILFAWGYNNNGQLGQNDRVNRSSPVQIGSDYWAEVSTGNFFSATIKADGTLWTWGQNDLGELGLGDTVYRSSPVQVGALTTWTKVSAGSDYALAIRQNGTLWAWGNNQYGQLGQNNFGLTTEKLSPVQVGALTTWAQVNAAGYSAFATKTDGTLWSWGYNSYGLLGQNDTVNRSSPVQVGALTTWNGVLGGVFVVKTDGTLWALGGNNSNGILGLNDRINRSSPVQVGALTTWAEPNIQTNGTLWTWGSNAYGELGDGTTINRSSPVQVGTDTGWTHVGFGSVFSVGIRSGNIYSWGGNSNGKLGSNQVWTTMRSSPVQIGSGSNWNNLSCAPEWALATSN